MKCNYKLAAAMEIAAKIGLTALLLAHCFLGLAAAASVKSPVEELSHSGAGFAIADFDGDLHPDLATVEAGRTSASESRYWIHFELSTGVKQAVAVRAPVGGIQLSSRDVNGDNAVDLVVSTSWLNQPVAVLLNDGHGNFTVEDPARFAEAFRNAVQHDSYSKAEWNDAPVAVPTRVRAQHLETREGPFGAQESSYAVVTPEEGFPKRQTQGNQRDRAPPDLCNHV
jgi:hypothetical protein